MSRLPEHPKVQTRKNFLILDIGISMALGESQSLKIICFSEEYEDKIIKADWQDSERR